MQHYSAIVIGVSAGGLAALSILLPALPADFRLPVIIVQHQKNDGQRVLAELLQSVANRPVVEAESYQEITPGTIFLAPAGYHLLIEAEKVFSLSVDPPVQYAIPSIDVLFESAADVYKEKLIGVILTGANSDGSQGLKKIREMGGLGIVEDPETADSPIMPATAIRSAGADHILSVNEIGSFLNGLNHGQ